MSRTRRLHDAFDLTDDDDNDESLGEADLIHGYTELEEPANGHDPIAELDDLLMGLPADATHVQVPVELARMIVYRWLLEQDV